MAYEHADRMLRHSVEDWNQWRKSQPAPDLSRSGFAEALLAGADLSGCDLSGADLGAADGRGTNFQRAVLSGVKLIGARLQRADFSGAEFSPARLISRQWGRYTGAASDRSIIEYTGEWPPHMRVSFRESDLRDARFVKTDLRTVDFVDANLRGAGFRQALLNGVDFHWANLEFCDLREAELRGSNLSYSNLSKADLRRVDLEGADLRLAHFLGANLLAANLRNIQFQWLADASELRRARNLLLAYLSSDLARELGFPESHNENVGKLDFRAYNLEGANLESADFLGGLLRVRSPHWRVSKALS